MEEGALNIKYRRFISVFQEIFVRNISIVFIGNLFVQSFSYPSGFAKSTIGVGKFNQNPIDSIQNYKKKEKQKTEKQKNKNLQ